MEHNRIPHVRNGDAVSDGRGFQRFAREQNLQEELPIHGIRQLENLDHVFQDG